jgi:hypothetical protein
MHTDGDDALVLVLKELESLKGQMARLERTGNALMAGPVAGGAKGRGGMGRNIGLAALLVTLHTVVVATGTAVVVVGLLTGHPLMELVLRLVQ